MVLYDFTAQVESYTRSLLSGLGSEEGVEDLGENFLFDSDAVVTNPEGVVMVCGSGSERHLGSV